MAKQLTIARPYAKAIFEVALADQQAVVWLQVLMGLALVVKDPQMVSVIHNPKFAREQLLELLLGIAKAMVPNLSAALLTQLNNTLALLVDAKRLEIIPDIAELFQRYYAKHQGVVELSVLSSHVLDEAQQQGIKVALEQRFNSKVSVDFSQDESLIGGLLIRRGNWVMDGSIRGKLTRLAETL